jgi:carboxynorspermidine decarboxylase
MMPTQSTGAGYFSNFDLSRVPSPCFVIDEFRLQENLQVIRQIADASGCHILLALKAFSMWSLAPLVSDYLQGCCASGLWEAKLARAHYGGHLSTYAPAYKSNEIVEIAALSDHVIFNSPAQIERYAAAAQAGGAQAGLRINPQHSEGHIATYDPCAPGSRLGWPLDKMPETSLTGITGLHIHTLCEQQFPPLKRTWAAMQDPLAALAARMQGQFEWLNLGGGHLLTHPDYDRDRLVALLTGIKQKFGVQTYLEPGTAVAFDAGILVGEVLDMTENDGPIAVLDVSATCHMPDVLEAPYRPALMQELPANKADSTPIRLTGPSCLAGDVIGEYALPRHLQAGDRLAFLDQAHYSMVKTTSFNGVGLPAMAIWNSQTDNLRLVREFSYQDFESRL